MEAVLSPPTRGLRGRSWFDWVYAAALVLGALFALGRYGAFMDIYEKAILLLTAPVFIALGWAWGAMRVLFVVVAAAAFLAIGAYQGELARSEQVFLLKYLLSSQSAIMWMCALFFLSTASYWAGLVTTSDFASKAGSGLAWSAAAFGTIGLLVRWYESYLIGADVGHIPVSNLYEVFVLFSVMTALFYLYYEERYATRQLGAFVMVVVSAAVGFLLWYTFEREAQEIQPLVPALQSWWMKIHVPANFVGYGTFSLAAMVGFAYLVKTHGEGRSGRGALALWGAAVVLALLLALEAVAFRKTGSSVFWLAYFAIFALVFGAIVAARRRIAARLPAREVLDDLMYRAIAVGFGFFTIATILGALWAAEAWGAYWSWDPKETWALIVWLNYAAWLHMRQMKGMRGAPLAWWALGGLLVTTFAFLGVNMFLSGLHSYGQL
jgi:cytochrome c-type biogenesis protein CcsB